MTSSAPVTFACFSAGFCFWTSKLRNVAWKPSASGRQASEFSAALPSAKSGPPRSTETGFGSAPIAIVPVALPPANASSIVTGPCLIVRFTGTSVPFSTVVVSTASPIGIFMVSVTTQVLPSSLTTRVEEICIVWGPAAIVPA